MPDYVFKMPPSAPPKPKKQKPEALPVIAAGDEVTLPVSVIADQFSDMRMAAAFAQMFMSVIRFWPGIGWLIFDGCRWTTDAPGGAFPLIRKLIESLFQRAAECSDYAARTDMLKAIFKLESHRQQETILAAAKNRPELIISASDLDRHDMLLTVNNGTIDLETGRLQQHWDEDFLTRLTQVEYDPAAVCPLFLKFLHQIFGGNQNIINYLQRFFGYCLTGRTGEQILLFFYGLGCNGKSVLANVLGAVLGDFASTATSDLLMARDHRSATNDVAALRGARLVKVSEFDDSEFLAEAQVKTLTGGDPVTCRFLYCESFTYVPTYKLLLIGNHRPKVRNRDHGLWRRLHTLNFCVTIPDEDRDPHLQEKLLKELPGILTWAVRGCLEWQKVGLAAPPEVKAATDEYRQSEDIFSQWVDECCTKGEHLTTLASELLASFIEYSKWKGTTPQKLGRMLTESGFIREKSGVIKWRGLGLIPSEKSRHWQDDKKEDLPF